jgi:Skp family chaperone for outer membrane proteins
MRKVLSMCAVAAFAALSAPATAQDQTVVLPSPIMVVDFERIFVETLYGKRIAATVSAERERVQADNDRIATELLAEEAALTEARATMEPTAFRDAARAFNERAQAVRLDREIEQTKLIELRDTERAQFLERIRPIVLALMLERGAVVAMDRRAVIQAIGGANGTEDAVSLIDITLGDGLQSPSEPPTLRPTTQDDTLPEVAPSVADDMPLETPLPQDDLPQSE